VTGDAGQSEPLLYDGAWFLLKRLAKKAGVKKKVNLHAFRYSRASRLANALTERQMEQYLGWTTGSKMPRVYVALSGRDTDTPILRMNGIEVEQAKTTKAKLPASTCPRCKQKNTALHRFCASCRLPLNLEVALQAEEAKTEAELWLNKLLENPEVRAVILKTLKTSLASQARGESQPSAIEHPLAQLA
jgi:integrase/recombinase XerD